MNDDQADAEKWRQHCAEQAAEALAATDPCTWWLQTTGGTCDHTPTPRRPFPLAAPWRTDYKGGPVSYYPTPGDPP